MGSTHGEARQPETEIQMEDKMTNAQLAKTEAEIAKIMAETVKINTESRWYPLVAGAAMATAVMAITKIFL